jgi:hypothetical protein
MAPFKVDTRTCKKTESECGSVRIQYGGKVARNAQHLSVMRFAGHRREAIHGSSVSAIFTVSPVDPDSWVAAPCAVGEFGDLDKEQRSAWYRPAKAAPMALTHSEMAFAAARLLQTDPAFTISAWIARGGQSNAKLLIEGLRKAGLPE